MPTPEGGYWLDGKRLPSVSTIIYPYSPGGNDPLMAWAVGLVIKYIEQCIADGFPENWRGIAAEIWKKARGHAADAGTITHDAIECYLRKEKFLWPFPVDELVQANATRSISAFMEWAASYAVRATHTEVQLTSKKYGYGGTLDAALIVKNMRALGDWKTSNKLQGKMLMQLAAYGNLWDENFPEDKIVGGFHLAQFNKNNGAFQHRHWPELDKQLRQFLCLREAYEYNKDTESKIR